MVTGRYDMLTGLGFDSYMIGGRPAVVVQTAKTRGQSPAEAAAYTERSSCCDDIAV